MTFFRTHLLRFLVPLLLAALGAAACRFLVPLEMDAVARQLIGFPDSDIPSHELRPLILQGLCFLPALGSLIYALGGTMDRYIAREFASIFTICLSSLVLIWLIMDLNDKIGDFRNDKGPDSTQTARANDKAGNPTQAVRANDKVDDPKQEVRADDKVGYSTKVARTKDKANDSTPIYRTILSFYAARSPAILMLLLPYSLLLSLLYSLGKLSGSREIIAMVQSGRSIVRITLPLIIIGIFFSLLSMGLNYHWAPTSEGNVKEILSEAKGKKAVEATNVLYLSPANHRLWKIGAFPHDYYMGEPLTDVEVTISRPDRTVESRITAKQALWNRSNHQWTFIDPVVGHLTPGQPTIFEKPAGPLVKDSWAETPFQLIKPGLSAGFLGIPDLTTWLKSNGHFASPSPYQTQWHYRWALPFGCLVTVLLATPLAVHFSRRGPGGGVILAVILSGLMLLVSNISLALGEAGTLQPMHAAWLPNIAFGILGLYLFHRRITGRPIYLVVRRLVPGND